MRRTFNGRTPEVAKANCGTLRMSCHARRGPIVRSRKETEKIFIMKDKVLDVGRRNRVPHAQLGNVGQERQEDTLGSTRRPNREGAGERTIKLAAACSGGGGCEDHCDRLGYVNKERESIGFLSHKEKVDRYEWQPSRKNESKKRLMRCQSCWTTPTRERNVRRRSSGIDHPETSVMGQ